MCDGLRRMTRRWLCYRFFEGFYVCVEQVFMGAYSSRAGRESQTAGQAVANEAAAVPNSSQCFTNIDLMLLCQTAAGNCRTLPKVTYVRIYCEKNLETHASGALTGQL